MKRLFLTIAVLACMGISVNLKAQGGDGFFDSNYRALSEDPEETTTGYVTKNDVPIGSGLLLLAGMGLIYLKMKKKIS